MRHFEIALNHSVKTVLSTEEKNLHFPTVDTQDKFEELR